MKIPSFLTSMGLAAFALLGLPGASAQEIVSTNEIACSKGGAEACFYAGADYAQGSNGLPVSMPKAAELFTKACALGVPLVWGRAFTARVGCCSARRALGAQARAAETACC